MELGESASIRLYPELSGSTATSADYSVYRPSIYISISLSVEYQQVLLITTKFSQCNNVTVSVTQNLFRYG